MQPYMAAYAQLLPVDQLSLAIIAVKTIARGIPNSFVMEKKPLDRPTVQYK